MQKLLIATSNAGKLAEYRAHLSDLNIELVSLKDLGLSSIEETGKTFEENAVLKAKSYFAQSGLPCVADDGGLEIDFLNGEPGVYSRRWKTGDETATDEELAAYTIERMQGVPREKRTARFRMVMAFIDAHGEVRTEEAATEGWVAEKKSIVKEGLPFDAVLFIPKFNKIRSELTPEQNDEINQRVAALKKLKPAIQSLIKAK